MIRIELVAPEGLCVTAMVVSPRSSATSVASPLSRLMLTTLTLVVVHTSMSSMLMLSGGGGSMVTDRTVVSPRNMFASPSRLIVMVDESLLVFPSPPPRMGSRTPQLVMASVAAMAAIARVIATPLPLA